MDNKNNPQSYTPSTDQDAHYANLSPTSRKLLIVLLLEQNPITTHEIGNRLGISARSVQYHIRKELSGVVRELGLILENKPNYGVSINNPDIEKKKLLEKLDKSCPKIDVFSIEQRRDFLTLHILFTDDYVDIDSLANKFNRSRGTILKDIGSLKKYLGNKDLELTWNKSKGYFIKGNERTIREIILNIIFANYSIQELIQICKNKQDIKGSTHPLGFLPNSTIFYLSKYPLRYYWDLIYFCERENNFQIDDPLRVEIALYLSLIIHRNLNRFNIDKRIHPNLSFSRDEFPIAEKIIQQLEIKHQLKLGYSEAAYLSLKLTLVSPNSYNHDQKKSLLSPFNQIHAIAKDIIQYSAQYLHPCLKTDQELFIGLCNHLEISINRIKNELFIKNYYLPEICRKYQYIYQIAKLCSSMIETNYNISFPDDEIGYLAMHFIAAIERLHLLVNQEINTSVICNEDSSVLIMLLSRLNAVYPSIAIKSIFDNVEISRDKINSKIYDLVISTTPVDYLDVPVIVVSPFLNQNDKNRILEIITKVNKRKLRNENEVNLAELPSLSSLLSKKNILLDENVNSWQEVVKLTCSILEKDNNIERRYSRAILNNLTTNGPYMVSWPHIALFHAKPSDGVRDLSIGLAKLLSPVPFGHAKNDPVYLAFVIATTDRISHLRVLYELSKICTDLEIVDRLIQANKKDEICDIIEYQCQLYQQINYP